MKRILVFTSLIILGLYLLLLSKCLVVEEIITLFLFPIFLFFLVAALFYLIIRLIRIISFKKVITISFLIAQIFQLLIVGLILWSVAPRYFSRKQVVMDIDYAIRVMEDVHPNLYGAVNKKNFYFRIDSIKRRLPEKISDVAAYKTFITIFSMIKDGHTRGGWNFFLNRMSFLFRHTPPFKIHIKNERFFVSKNYFYRNTIPVGSEILEINGKSSSQCLSEVSRLLSYETISFRNSILQTPFIWALWNDFNSFEITYKTPDSKIRTIKTSGGLISKLVAFNEMRMFNEKYSYKIISDNIGYIDLNSFNDFDSFKVFLDSTFTLIKAQGVKYLILDVRRNSGGNSSLGDELLQYISSSDFRMFDSCFIKISNELNNKKYFDWIDSSKRIVGEIYKSSDTSKVGLRYNPLRFTGKSYLLVSGNTFSSASKFASAFHCYKVGEIIGTETGGKTVSFGDLYSFALPNTKFDMGVSYKKFYGACGVDDGRGVIPDYVVESSIEDDHKGVDRVMEFTIDLIKKKKE